MGQDTEMLGRFCGLDNIHIFICFQTHLWSSLVVILTDHSLRALNDAGSRQNRWCLTGKHFGLAVSARSHSGRTNLHTSYLPISNYKILDSRDQSYPFSSSLQCPAQCLAHRSSPRMLTELNYGHRELSGTWCYDDHAEAYFQNLKRWLTQIGNWNH